MPSNRQPLIDSPMNPSAGGDAELQQEVARVQLSGVLGEARLRNLFDYLAKNTLAGHSPKEIAIAVDVFGKSSDFDAAQDALVRVYIHKLRKALDEFYGSRSEPGARLHLPRGEYRLQVSTAPPAMPGPGPAKNRHVGILRALVVLIAAVLTGLFALAWHRTPPLELDRVRANPIWSAILKDERPILIVFGDYYLIGETDDSMNVNRLVREYSVNSKSDLERYIVEHPSMAARYMDVGIRYLPISAAFALRDVMAVLAPQNKRISIAKMSDVEPSSLKSADIVYIGYLSGMGMLQDLVFTGSRFTIGESYDEIIDTKTRHTYISQVGSQIMDPPQPTGREQSYHDYGLFEKLRGPSGNTILVIAGTRDEGVSQTAEAFTGEQKLNELGRRADLTLPLEALLEVGAFSGTNLTGKLLLQSNRDRATN
jgi:hypothetical protein